LFGPFDPTTPDDSLLTWPGTLTIAAVENASGLCGDDEPLDRAFERLEWLVEAVGTPLYISLTHHGENRFGGGNQTQTGLKDDGRALLEALNRRGIAVDLSHTCDALARDILAHIDRRGLDLPILASHSNFRAVHDIPRNLPDDLAREVIARGGVIGMNLLRNCLHPEDPSSLTKHLCHGLELGGEKTLCFGADYFDVASHPDQSRAPFYFEEHQHAGKYQQILDGMAGELSPEQIKRIAHGNALAFIRRLCGFVAGSS
jgi:microsomal dipeptidase-like Zn-dependent dipeptidase